MAKSEPSKGKSKPKGKKEPAKAKTKEKAKAEKPKKAEKEKKKKGGSEDPGCFGGGGGDKKKEKKPDKKGGKAKDKKGGKAKGAPKKSKSNDSIRSVDSIQLTKSRSSSPSKSTKKGESPSKRSSISAGGKSDGMMEDHSQPGSDAASRKLRFDELVQVKEIPDKFAARAEQAGKGGIASPAAGVTASMVRSPAFTPSGSELDVRTEPRYGDPYFGSLTPARSVCPSESQKMEADLYSVKSMTLDEPGPIFDPNRCPPYSRDELISVMETLVLGINDRESLKNRYEEETTRLAMNAEFYADKVEQAKAKLECLRNQANQLDKQITESADVMSRNFLQLTRERKRIAGAVDLKEDFDRHLQQQITTKTKFVQDYAQILGKLEGLVDDSSLQWVQRETMISTESEALERLHQSVEKEQHALANELHKYESLYVAQAAQNSKLGQVVERELEKYSKKQQEIIRYNEKRIRALEGCIRTMQLDREVMYGEIAENRNRLREVLEARIMTMMEKIRMYKEVLRGLETEIGTLIFRSDSVLPATPALQAYIRMVSAIDVLDFAARANTAKTLCEEAETQWRAKNCQKRDLTDIRKSYVDLQRRQMLISEDEYFLMEPVEVPGTESHTNFQRSLDCFVPNQCTGGAGAATRAQYNLDRASIQLNVTPMPEPQPPSDAVSYKSSKIAGDASTIPEPPPPPMEDHTTDTHFDSASTKDKRSFRKRTLQSVTSLPRKTIHALGSGFKKLSSGVGHAFSLKHSH